MKHALKIPGFLDPFWFNKVKGTIQIGVAVTPRALVVEGETLHLCQSETIMLVPGEKVHVSLFRQFTLQTEAEKVEEERVLQQEQERRLLARKIEAKLRKEEADAFNADLNVPVGWVPGQKDVISGLTPDSMGNGSYAGSVVHILLSADLHQGRLYRKAGWFLCSRCEEDNGKQWSGTPELGWHDCNGQWYRPKVNCKGCLQIAKRWRKRDV